MILAASVGVAAGLGAVSRYVVDRTVQRRYGTRLPWGTLVVNVSGAFLLGLVTGLAIHHGLPHVPTVVLSAGFCSGYTTWSTFMWETLSLAEDRAPTVAAGYVALSVGAGLAAAAAGFALALV